MNEKDNSIDGLYNNYSWLWGLTPGKINYDDKFDNVIVAGNHRTKDVKKFLLDRLSSKLDL